MRISDWSSDVCSSDLNGDALVAAAIAGMGIVYQPTFIVPDAVADGRLEILELDHPPFDLGNIYAVYPPTEHLPPSLRFFIDFLIYPFASSPPCPLRFLLSSSCYLSLASFHTCLLLKF